MNVGETFKNVMSIFNSAPATPTAMEPTAGQPAPAAPNAAPITNPNPNFNPDPANPTGAQAATAAGAEGANKSPLDEFTKLWDTKPNPGVNSPSVLQIDPVKLQEQVGKLNFSSVVPADLAAKALAGDAASFAQVLNTVAQAGFSQAIQVNSALVEKAIEQHTTKMEATMAEKFKNLSANNTLTTENAAFAHPAAKPLINALEQQLALTYPNATPAELASSAKSYMTAFASSLAPAPAATDNGAAAASGQNWDAFFKR